MVTTSGWYLALGLAAAAALQQPAAKPEMAKQELERPADWIVRHDQAGEQKIYFVKMPPGWHVTTGPGSILYHPDKRATGRYRVEAEIFLFPGTSAGGHGIFFGGQHLDGSGNGPAYWTWQLDRDGTLTHGRYLQGRREGGAEGAKHPAVVPSSQDKAVKNVLAVEVDGDTVRLFVNGQHVGTTTIAGAAGGTWDGTVGLRVDADVNLHLTRLDVIAR
jgi:hypothetical protein